MRGYWYNPLTAEAKNGKVSPGEQWERRRYHDALRLIYKLYAGGDYSYDTLTAALNQAGWRFTDRYSQPRLFDLDDVRRAIAYWRLFRGELPTGKIQRKSGQILTGGHAPVLPVELCNQVGLVAAKREKKFSRPTRLQGRRVYLLSGVLHCAACQRPLKGATYKEQGLYRHLGAKGKCPEKWLPADMIEAEVINHMVMMGDAELLEEIRAEAERLAREVFTNSDTGQGILAELDRQKERLKRLEDLYLDGDIERGRYQARRSEIVEAIAKFENELYTTNHLTNFNEVLARITATLAQITESPPETQKGLIYSLFERIEVAGGKITRIVPRPWASGFF